MLCTMVAELPALNIERILLSRNLYKGSNYSPQGYHSPHCCKKIALTQSALPGTNCCNVQLKTSSIEKGGNCMKPETPSPTTTRTSTDSCF